MPIYKLTISTEIVVEADSADDAMFVAEREAGRAMRDVDPDIVLHGEVKCIADLPAGWDGECLPYGDNMGDNRLRDILAT